MQSIPDSVSYQTLLDALYHKGAHDTVEQLDYYVQLVRDLTELNEACDELKKAQKRLHQS